MIYPPTYLVVVDPDRKMVRAGLQSLFLVGATNFAGVFGKLSQFYNELVALPRIKIFAKDARTSKNSQLVVFCLSLFL